MSAVAELINQLCPNGVEYKTLGEVARIERGNGLAKSDFVDSGIPCIHYGQLYTRFDTVATNALTCVSAATAATLKRLHQGDVLMAVTSENIEDVCKCIAWLGDGDVVVGGHTAIIRHTLNPKYLAYWFQTYEFFVQKRKLAHGTKVIEVTPSCLADVMLPVPPLPVQQEIVRRLDAMTGLIEDLEKELAARQKQYEWVREETFKQLETEGVERKKLGEICTYSTRRIGVSHVTAKTFVSVENMLQDRRGRMDAVSVPTVGNVISFEAGDVLIGNIRPYLKKIWCADTSGGTNGDVLVIQRKNSESILSRYLYQVLSSDDFFRYDMKYSKGAKMPRGDKVAVMKYVVPVPSLPIQQMIVRRLDEMTELIAAIEKEIALRKQQYEYCRDELMNFKKAEVAA